ncbi:MAG: hypothetical protein OXC28_07360 [Defluviicoccus sp.]|nr:hypothetical protein [Defluviicoccus sp.]
MRQVRTIAGAAALAAGLAAAPAGAHMSPACLAAILKYSAASAGATAIAFPLAGADAATAALMRPALAEMKRKASRTAETAFRECVVLEDGTPAPPDKLGAAREEGRMTGPGPMLAATVVRVIDGDTVEVDARPWPGQTMRVAVRLSDYDAPELRGKCAAEREAGAAAAAALERLLPAGAEVRLAGVRNGSFAGRVVAQLVTAEGRDPVEALLAAGHGRGDPGGKHFGRESWCDAS